MAMPIAAVGMPTVSLSFLAGRSALGRSSLSFAKSSAPRSASLFQTSFLASPCSSPFFPSSFSGLSLCIDFGPRIVKEKYRGLQVRAGKAALCMTKRSRSRKSLARTHGFRRRMRTHGFRRRMRTTSGRAVLKRRRAKGRNVLCTKSNPISGKRASP